MSRLLDIDTLVKEQDEIMDKYENDLKNPSSLWCYRQATAIKVYLLQLYSKQKKIPFTSRWIIHKGKEVCEVCRRQRKVTELNGICVGCDAKIIE